MDPIFYKYLKFIKNLLPIFITYEFKIFIRNGNHQRIIDSNGIENSRKRWIKGFEIEVKPFQLDNKAVVCILASEYS